MIERPLIGQKLLDFVDQPVTTQSKVVKSFGVSRVNVITQRI